MTWRPSRFRLGSLRDRITVQSPTATIDAAGQTIRTWAALFTNEPASFDSASGGETQRGKQVDATITAVFTVHFRDGYTTEQRVLYNGQTYGIVYVRPVEGGRRYIELHCKGAA